MPEPLSVAFNADHTRAAFTIHHPTGNILTADVLAALRSALEDLGDKPHLRLITIEGAGPDFSFGASIPEHAPDRIGTVLPEMHALIYEWLEAPAPTAALVRGRCFGGGFELALACDFILAENSATFALPEIALGVFPPAAAALLPLRVGHAAATRAIVTGEVVSAAYWGSTHLVQLVPDGDLQDAVEGWFASGFARRSAAALRHATTAARVGLLAHVRDVLPKLERLYLDELMRTHDAVEGINAFMNKRAPLWKDR